MIEIDITELLEDYVRLLEQGGIPRESTESKIMLKAKEEIERLRKQLDFQIKLANDNNDSRLELLDVICNARELYEDTCKSIRESTVETYVCGMCKWDCDTSITECGEPVCECPGFDKDDCFELDNDKYNKIIFKN